MDGFSFDGLLDADGSPVIDLNDFCHVSPDVDPNLIASAFNFVPESQKETCGKPA